MFGRMAKLDLVACLVILVFFGLVEGQCSEQNCNQAIKQICESVKHKKVTGHLCKSLCKEMMMLNCSTDLASYSDQYYYSNIIKKSNSNYICPMELTSNHLSSSTSPGEFLTMLYELIEKRLNYSESIEHIVQNLIVIGDMQDHPRLMSTELDRIEMSTIWGLMNRKDFFYMIALKDKPYIPEVTGFCGDFVAIEPVYGNKAAYPTSKEFSKIKSWQSRFKFRIALGILDFFIDAPLFNPNDEYGADSLYLCSPIDQSFGYSFIFDAKLLKYDYLFTAKELESELAHVSCTSDSDCTFNNVCQVKCLNGKCSQYLVRPQLVEYCAFAINYLADTYLSLSKQFKTFQALLVQCLQLKSIYPDNKIYYNKESQAAVSQELMNQRSSFWNYTMEYMSLTDDLKSIMWGELKRLATPARPSRNVVNSNKVKKGSKVTNRN